MKVTSELLLSLEKKSTFEEKDKKNAINLAFEEGNTDALDFLLKQKNVTLHSIFSAFLDPQSHESADGQILLQNKKEFTFNYLSNRMPPEAAHLIVEANGNVHDAYALAVAKSDNPKKSPVVKALGNAGAIASMAVEKLFAEKALNKKAVEFILDQGNFDSKSIRTPIELAAKGEHGVYAKKMAIDYKAEFRDTLRAAANLHDVEWGIAIVSAKSKEPTFLPIATQGGPLSPAAKILKDASLHANEKQLNTLKEKLVDKLPQGTDKDLLLGHLVVGYARLGKHKIIHAVSNEFSSQENREAYVNNLSSSSLFRAIESGELKAVQAVVALGGNVNTLVAETNAFPLLAASHQKGKQANAIFNFLADQGAVCNMRKGKHPEVEERLASYHENHPEAALRQHTPER
jgi:hypothetical protein